MKSYFLLLLIAFSDPSKEIIGIWKLRSYDAINAIKSSPSYIFADESSRQIIDNNFKDILKNGFYSFATDTLVYADMERNEVVFRRALWSLERDILKITEIDRPFKREAFVRKLTQDSLILSPVIDNKVRISKMIFTRE